MTKGNKSQTNSLLANSCWLSNVRVYSGKGLENQFACMNSCPSAKIHLVLYLHKACVELVSLLKVSSILSIWHIKRLEGHLHQRILMIKEIFHLDKILKGSMGYLFIIGLLFQDQTCSNSARYQSKLGINWSKSEKASR